jgi:hypothetical protein
MGTSKASSLIATGVVSIFLSDSLACIFSKADIVLSYCPCFGQVLGIVHVLTGPDHLSALATLSANAAPLPAFFLGVRWGIGHSTGLILVGGVMIAVTLDSSDAKVHVPAGVSTFFESLVGVFMLILGAYGFRRAWERKSKVMDADSPSEKLSDDQLIGQNDFDDCNENRALACEKSAVVCELGDLDVPRYNSTQPIRVQEELKGTDEENVDDAATNDGAEGEDATESSTEAPRRNCCASLFSRISTGTMALLAGLIHGMAGPGGVLGVIPAVQLHNWRLACIYLGAFCSSSILTMGTYATVYGTISSKVGVNAHRRFVIECLSAGLSVLIGTLWLILLAMGKLDAVFP